MENWIHLGERGRGQRNWVCGTTIISLMTKSSWAPPRQLAPEVVNQSTCSGNLKVAGGLETELGGKSGRNFNFGGNFIGDPVGSISVCRLVPKAVKIDRLGRKQSGKLLVLRAVAQYIEIFRYYLPTFCGYWKLLPTWADY
jgi:hypothetical protein